MKKFLALILAGMMALSLVSCDKGDDDVVRKIGMVYSEDEVSITLSKPDNAAFNFYGEDPMESGDLAGICADDYSWDAEIAWYQYYEGIGSNVPFVDYYFAGSVNAEDYSSYSEEITELDISYKGAPIKVIRYTYKEVDEEEEYNECFVGFEYKGSSDAGLFGLKIVVSDEELSDEYLTDLMTALLDL